ncbi:MAG: DUF2812 domain-containing protein [Bacillota bacterium]|nr:DUF2812 domain-containing protein [Bacillota bacterium]
MRKTLLFSKLNYENAEEKLSKMEMKGLRLDSVSGLHRFDFCEGKPKNTAYFFVFNFMKEYRSYELEMELVKKYGACPVKGQLKPFDGIMRIYRLTNPTDELAALKAERGKYLIHVFEKRLIISLMLLLLITVPLLLRKTVEGKIVWAAIVCASLVMCALWNLYGIAVLKRRQTLNNNSAVAE